MRKSYKFKKKLKFEKAFNYNYQIKSPEVQVIDENGAPLGKLLTRDALSMALERGLDLVEVAPNADPPVARFLNFGSFQYQREKQLKKQRLQTKTFEVKSIRLSIKISDHDRDTRIKQTEKFLAKGHKVKLEIILKGRELSHIDLAKIALKEFYSLLAVQSQIEQEVTKQGNKLFLILMPVK